MNHNNVTNLQFVRCFLWCLFGSPYRQFALSFVERFAQVCTLFFFISEMEMTAEEAFQSLAPKMGRPNDKEIKAQEFLLEMLKDGEMLSSD